MIKRFVYLLVFSLWAGAAFSQVSIYPASPKMFETVRVRVPEGAPSFETFDVRGTRISMEGRKVTASVVARRVATGPEPFPALDLPLGQFPAGSYEVEVRVVSPDGAFLRSPGSTSFTIPARATEEPLWNLTDLWWTPEESGWGINMIQHGSGVIFATWFIYGTDGKATWYVIPEGRWTAEGVQYVGPIYRTTGPEFCFDGQFCRVTGFDPASVTRTLVGEGKISIFGSNFERAIITMTIDGKTLTRQVRRQPF